MRYAVGFVVGLPIGYTSYHEKRTYALYVKEFEAQVIRNKKVVTEIQYSLITYLVGARSPIKDTDDFARVADVFISSIFARTPIEVQTDKFCYNLWMVEQGGWQCVIK